MRLGFATIAVLGLILSLPGRTAQAQETRRAVSQCQAVAQTLPEARFLKIAADAAPRPRAAEETVTITFIGHSTYFIETPGGVSIATDYNGVYRPPRTPTVATMNHAHSTHYTMAPEAGIEHILHGWSDVPGEKAKINLTVGDTFIRNVTTDIRGGWTAPEADGNSIFIFEVAGLCIGHLGHLHYELTKTQYAEVGRLDVVMVPVDGGLTMGADSMSRIIKRLRASLVLPMHQRGPLANFLTLFGPDFDIAMAPTDTVTVSLLSLPKKPLIHVVRSMQ